MLLINPNANPTLQDAKKVFKQMSHYVNFFQYICDITFFECPRNELKDWLDGAVREETNIISADGKLVSAYYIDDDKHIMYEVLIFDDKAFVMKMTHNPMKAEQNVEILRTHANKFNAAKMFEQLESFLINKT